MNLIVTPKDLIERCVWDKYQYYILRSPERAIVDDIVKKNEPFELKEEYAFVIGLLRVTYTNNLLHKFNMYLHAKLEAKSFTMPGTAKKMINREILIACIDKFLKFFPPAYEPDIVWQKEIDKVRTFTDKLKEQIIEMDVIFYHDISCVSVGLVNKMLEVHHG